jgi:hypothetical protein
MRGKFLRIEGTLQKQDEVINVRASAASFANSIVHLQWKLIWCSFKYLLMMLDARFLRGHKYRLNGLQLVDRQP